MADKFKIGDVVKAKGIAGPDMSVEGFSGYNPDLVECFWFSGKKRETASFHEDTLILSPSPPTE